LALAHGMDPMLFLDNPDPVSVMLLSVVLKRAMKIKQEMRTDLANRIANALGGE